MALGRWRLPVEIVEVGKKKLRKEGREKGKEGQRMGGIDGGKERQRKTREKKGRKGVSSLCYLIKHRIYVFHIAFIVLK